MLFRKSLWPCVRLVPLLFVCGLATLRAQTALECIDESESGRFLQFEDESPGIIRLRLDGALLGDYPGFAIEADGRFAGEVIFRLEDTPVSLLPAFWTQARGWSPIRVLKDAGGLSFHVPIRGPRTLVRLW